MTFSLGSAPRSLVKYNDQSVSAITEVGSGAGVTDDMVLIETITASSDSTIEFDSGIDDTYPIYLIKYYGCHPSSDDAKFLVNFRDGSTSYDATKTTTFFQAHHRETAATTNLVYSDTGDLAQSTGGQRVTGGTGADNDQCGNGELYLFNPSSTTFVKHFIGRSAHSEASDYIEDSFLAGYCNVTAAIDGVQFSFASGNIDAGSISLYGIS